jgi:hypothetical protein
VDVNANAVTGALDLDAADAGTVEAAGEQRTNLDVLGYVVLVTLTLLSGVREPTRLVVGSYAKSETVWVDFLTH